MKSNINIQPLTLVRSIPDFNPDRPNIRPYSLFTKFHQEDGWRDYLRPVFDSETQRLGQLIYDKEKDIVTNEVINIPAEEIEERRRSRALSEAEARREERIQEIRDREAERAIMEPVHAITDKEEIQANKDLYPIWEKLRDDFVFEMPFKVQAYEDGELIIFDLVQPHTKQIFHPLETPALWNPVRFGDDGVEVWDQQVGNTGKYPLINPDTGQPYVVSHQNELWQNRRAGINTFEPGTNGSGWMQISNTPAPWYNLGNEGYPIDWELTHNGFVWKSNMDANFWEPGVFGWTLIGNV